MMAYFRLRSAVSFGLVGGRPIFLDLRRDRYVALDSAAEAAFLDLLANAGAPVEPPSIEILLATELFEPAKTPQPLEPASIECATRLIGHQGSCSARDIAEVSMSLWRARRLLGRMSIESIVQRLWTSNGPSADLVDTTALAARFARARAFVPIVPSCLQDSLALRDWLERRSAAASMVFGVKLDPFAAHCWLQAGDTVLNDAPDRTSQFTPILVLA